MFKIQKTFYRLEQAYHNISSRILLKTLNEIGFYQSYAACYSLEPPIKVACSQLYVFVYVDDIIVRVNDAWIIAFLKVLLKYDLFALFFFNQKYDHFDFFFKKKKRDRKDKFRCSYPTGFHPVR